MRIIHPAKCECGAFYDVLKNTTTGNWCIHGPMYLQAEDGTVLDASHLQTHESGCPGCGREEVQKVFKLPGGVGTKTSINRSSERYPYFDRGLGRMLTSESHRRTVCKEMGVIPVGGDTSIPTAVTDKWREQDELVEQHERNLKMYNEHPAFADYRKARDQGQVEGVKSA